MAFSTGGYSRIFFGSVEYNVRSMQLHTEQVILPNTTGNTDQITTDPNKPVDATPETYGKGDIARYGQVLAEVIFDTAINQPDLNTNAQMVIEFPLSLPTATTRATLQGYATLIARQWPYLAINTLMIMPVQFQWTEFPSYVKES